MSPHRLLMLSPLCQQLLFKHLSTATLSLPLLDQISQLIQLDVMSPPLLYILHFQLVLGLVVIQLQIFVSVDFDLQLGLEVDPLVVGVGSLLIAEIQKQVGRLDRSF